MAHLSIRNLSVSYRNDRGDKTSVLSDVNLEVEDGEICALLGPSGGGKSTLLHTISRLTTDYTGEILLQGEPPCPKQHHIALVPQHFGLLPWKRVRDNILLPQALGKRCLSSRNLDDIIQALDIEHLLDRYPHVLSGGQKQRVALARAFGLRPDILLLDEPFSALDIVTAERSKGILRQLWATYPTTTIIVTHAPNDAIELADRIAVLGGHPGRILTDLTRPTPEDIAPYLHQAYHHHE